MVIEKLDFVLCNKHLAVVCKACLYSMQSTKEIYLDEVDEVRNNWRNGRMGGWSREYNEGWQHHGRLSTGLLEQHYDDSLSALWSGTMIAVIEWLVRATLWWLFIESIKRHHNDGYWVLQGDTRKMFNYSMKSEVCQDNKHGVWCVRP